LKEEPPAQKAPHPEGHDPEEKSADLDQEGEQPRPEPAPSVNRPTVRPKSSGTPRSPKPKKVAPSGSAPARKADGAFRPTGI
jgi:hypothetical protein